MRLSDLARLDKSLRITHNGEEVYSLDTENYADKFAITMQEYRDFDTDRATGCQVLTKINWRIEINDVSA